MAGTARTGMRAAAVATAAATAVLALVADRPGGPAAAAGPGAVPAAAAPPPAAVAARVRDIVPPRTAAPAALFAAAPAPGPAADAPADPPAPPAPGAAEAPACVEALSLAALPGAMLVAVLTVPCRGGARVELRHAGLAVTLAASPAGTLTAILPALDAGGAVAAVFADGQRLEAAAQVDLAGLARFAVQWTGTEGFRLHAFAAGAAFGGPGHVHAGAPGSPGGSAGHLHRLGDASLPDARLAEVYTFPADRSAVALDLETPLTPATCGRAMRGETFQAVDGALLRRDFLVRLPACGEESGFLVLQNPLADLKLPAR